MRVNKKSILAIIFILLLAAGWVTYRYSPGKVIKGLQKIAVWDAELTMHQIDVDNYSINYYEGGGAHDPALVLLHGLGDDKNSFVRSVNKLTDDFHVILPDLPGHGDNNPSTELNYDIDYQVSLLSGLIHSLNISSFYLGGNSMGGHAALSYIDLHPGMVKGLILINATGIEVGGETVYQKFPEEMDKAMFDELMSRVFASPPRVPAHFIEYARKEMNAKSPFLNHLIQEVIDGQDYFSTKDLKEITVPTLILWGKQDQIVPFQFADAFHGSISNSTIQIIPNAGHTPQFEAPEIVGKGIGTFVHSIENIKRLDRSLVD